MTSVLIAAHNEEAVIGRCLDALRSDTEPGELDITVAANGCTDRTAEVARSRPGVRVLDLERPSKPGALNAADAVAVGFPRIILDADIFLTGAEIRTLAAAVTGPGAPLAATARRRLDLSGRPLLVRSYFAVNGRLPAFHNGLFGRGVIALSEAGRARFGEFPEMIADDLFLDSLFGDDEKRQVDEVVSVVATPLRTEDLLRRLTRVRAGNAAMRDAHTTVRRSARSSWLRDVVLPRPWLAPAAVGYVALTLTAASRARAVRGQGTDAWGRDESSRVASPGEARAVSPRSERSEPRGRERKKAL